MRPNIILNVDLRCGERMSRKFTESLLPRAFHCVLMKGLLRFSNIYLSFDALSSSVNFQSFISYHKRQAGKCQAWPWMQSAVVSGTV